MAIANATDVGLAGRCPSRLSGSHNISQAGAGVFLLDTALGFEKDTLLEHMSVAFREARGWWEERQCRLF